MKRGLQNIRMTNGHYVHIYWEDDFSEVRIECDIASFKSVFPFSLIDASNLREVLSYIIHEKEQKIKAETHGPIRYVNTLKGVA